jgi:hypothetical protein
MAASTASWVAASILSDKVEEDPSLDVGGGFETVAPRIDFFYKYQPINKLSPY